MRMIRDYNIANDPDGLRHHRVSSTSIHLNNSSRQITSTRHKSWAYVIGFLLLGYLSMGRSFAYLGIPPLRIFIGEMVLGAFLFQHPRAIVGKWAGALMSASPLSGLAWAIYLFVGYGIFQLLRGIILGYPPLTAIQCFVFNIYPLYFFIGLWIGHQHTWFLDKIIYLLAWWNSIYGVAYILALSHLPWTIPGVALEVELFGLPGGTAVAILGLLSFERKLARSWLLLLTNAFVLLGLQVRAEWLGFLASLLLWGWLSKRLGLMLKGISIIIILIGVGYATDFSLPSPKSRGGEISVREIFARAIAPLNPEMASKYTRNTEAYAGTATWRMNWWRAIWDSVHQNETNILLGHGYGFHLGGLGPYQIAEDTRTPHNVFLYALAYGGWIGVIIFITLQLFLVRLLWIAYRLTKQPFGIAFWVLSLFMASFGNFFETPFGAIPFYLLIGLAIAPALTSKGVDDARPVVT